MINHTIFGNLKFRMFLFGYIVVDPFVYRLARPFTSLCCLFQHCELR